MDKRPTKSETHIRSHMLAGLLRDDKDRDCYTLFVPTTPIPTSGFLQIVPKEQVVVTTLSVEEGIKMVVTGGILSPKQFNRATCDPPAIREEPP